MSETPMVDAAAQKGSDLGLANEAWSGIWPLARQLERELTAALARITELEKRLEISPEHGYDGIDCRNETIKLQDERIAELEKERDALLTKWERGCFCLMEMMQAYERRIRSLSTPEEIEKRPWECAEYRAAAAYLRAAWPTPPIDAARKP